MEAYSLGFAGTAIFTATGTQGPPGILLVDTGNNQIGATNQPLPKPLITEVIDNGRNRLANVPVTFTVRQGGGSFGGQSTFTVNTDSDGRAAATLTLGSQEGNSNNIVEASLRRTRICLRHSPPPAVPQAIRPRPRSGASCSTTAACRFLASGLAPF